MNKNTIRLLCAIGAVLVLVVAALLISHGDRQKEPQGNTGTENITDTQDRDEGDTQSTGGTESADTQNGEGSETTLPFSATLGVGDADDSEYGDDATQSIPQISTQPIKTNKDQTDNGQADDNDTSTGNNDTSGSTEGTTAVVEELTYEAYLALTPAERIAYYKQFSDDEAFTTWFNDALAAYEGKDSIEVGSGTIDMGDILNPDP